MERDRLPMDAGNQPQLPRPRRLRHTAAAIAIAVAAVGLLGLLLLSHQRELRARQDHAHDAYSRQAHDLAEALSYFCMERRDDLRDLLRCPIMQDCLSEAADPETPCTLTEADIEAVREQFGYLLLDKQVRERSVYRLVALVGPNGKLLVTAGNAADQAEQIVSHAYLLRPTKSDPSIHVHGHLDEDGQVHLLAMAAPYQVNGEYLGEVVALIDTNSLYRHIAERSLAMKGHSAIVLDGQLLFDERANHPPEMQALLEAAGGAPEARTVTAAGHEGRQWAVVRCAIGGTPLTLKQLTDEKTLLRDYPLDRPTGLTVLALVVLLVGILLYRSSMRNGLLQTKLELEAQRTVELESTNERLSEEMHSRRQAEIQLEQEALRDALTGLPNRNLFTRHLNLALKSIRFDSSHRFALLFLDFDRFKLINDSLGHQVGDLFLKEAAKRLQLFVAWYDQTRRPDADAPSSLARFGGDEFALLLLDIGEHDEIEPFVEYLHSILSESYNLEGREVFTTVSIGVALGENADQNTRDLLRDADTAMYRAKTQGKGSYVLFDQAMHDEVHTSLELVSDMRRAIERDQLRLFYQPIIDLHSNGLLGFEALIRWEHPIYGLVSPPRFIPLAEDTGMIVPIGQWVIEQACQQIKLWREKYPSLYVSVNVSKRQLMDPDLPRFLEDMLGSRGLTADAIKVEVTESIVIEEAEATASVLQQLKSLGLDLMMDDFGTGNSSLARLHEFPVDYLKIDRAFLQVMTNSRPLAAMLHAVVTLAHNLELQVVCEGVESRDQVAELIALECDSAQGYLFARPMPADQATHFLTTIDPAPSQRAA